MTAMDDRQRHRISMGIGIALALFAFFFPTLFPAIPHWIAWIGTFIGVAFFLWGVYPTLTPLFEKRRSPSKKNDLTIYFDPVNHRIEAGEWTAFCIGVRNESQHPVERVVVTVEKVDPLGNDENLRDALRRFKNVPLIEARWLDKRTEIPATETSLFGAQETTMAMVAFARGAPPSLRVCHNSFKFSR